MGRNGTEYEERGKLAFPSVISINYPWNGSQCHLGGISFLPAMPVKEIKF